MANYTASALLAAQTRFTQAANAAELRRKLNPALMLALKNANPLIVDAQTLRTKESRPVKAYIKKKRAAVATTTKAYNHTGGKSDSSEVTLAYITIIEPFSIHLKQAQGNVISYGEMLAHEILQSAENIHGRAGTLAQTFLQSNRNQVNIGAATGGAGTWDNVNKALTIAAGDKDRFFQMVSSFMRKQNYRGTLDVIADQPAFRNAEFLRAQGAANNNNLSWQLANMNIVETTEDIDANFTNGSVLALPSNSFAALPWNDPANAKGKGDYDSVLGGFGVLADPLGSGLNFDFHAYTQRADASGSGGHVQDETLEAEVSLTLSWVLSPLTTANESVVHEIAQLA